MEQFFYVFLTLFYFVFLISYFYLMFFIIFSTILILPVLMGFGEFSRRLFGEIGESISVKIFSGIFLLAMVWQVLAFFIPLTAWLEGISILLGISSFFYFKTYQCFFKFSNKEWVKITLISLLIAFAGSYYPFILDHFGYYAPSIKWLNEFGLTKGLANLDLVYAQMSVWHIFQAGFSHFADGFLRINVVFLIAFLIYIFEKKAWHLLLVSPIFLLFVQSPSPDLPAIALSLVVLNEILEGNKNLKWLFAFSVFVFTIKPTMVWLPIFVFLNFFRKENLKPLSLGMTVFAIYVFKNLWLFGYPFFPMQIGDFGFSWMPNAEVLKESSHVAVLKTFDMQYTFSEIQKFSTGEYIYHWLFINSYKKYIHIAFFLSLILFGLYTLKKKERMLTILLVSVFLKSVLVLVFSGQYRFFLEVFFVIFVAVFHQKIKEKWALLGFGLASIFILMFLSFPRILQSQISSFKLGHYMQGLTKTQLYKPAYFELNSFQTYEMGNLKFNIPHYDLSFDTPQPSLSSFTLKTYQVAGVFPQKIGKNIKEGFVWKKLSPEERKKLKEIIFSLDKKQ